jgi:hypothetical protein
MVKNATSAVSTINITARKEQMSPITSFASGGYTGEWNNTNGKLAVLHEKELILNKEDTQRLLDAMVIAKDFGSDLSTNFMKPILDMYRVKYTPRTKPSRLNISNLNLTLPNVHDVDDFIEGLKQLPYLAKVH